MDHASSDDETSTTEGSFVKVRDEKPADEDALDNTGESEPDVYDVDVLAWDAPVSALHIAIIGGHIDVIKVLVSNFGAEVLLPIKIVDSYSQNPKHAIMTLVLAAQISGSASSDVAKELLSLGASSAQADLKQVSAFHYLVAKRRVELLKACLELDRAAASTVLGHLILEDAHWRPKVESPLTTAIRSGDEALVGAVLDFGAKPFTDLDDFAAAYSHALGNAPSYWRKDDDTDISKIWKEEVAQPVLLAVEHEMPAVIMDMVEAGADIDTIDREAHQSISRLSEGEKFNLQGGSLLDAVTMKISSIESAINFHFQLPEPRELMDDQTYLEATTPGSYERWFLSKTVEMANNVLKQWRNDRNERLTKEEERPGKQQRVDALRALQKGFVGLKEKLLQRVCVPISIVILYALFICRKSMLYSEVRLSQSRDAYFGCSPGGTYFGRAPSRTFQPKAKA